MVKALIFQSHFHVSWCSLQQFSNSTSVINLTFVCTKDYYLHVMTAEPTTLQPGRNPTLWNIKLMVFNINFNMIILINLIHQLLLNVTVQQRQNSYMYTPDLCFNRLRTWKDIKRSYFTLCLPEKRLKVVINSHICTIRSIQQARWEDSTKAILHWTSKSNIIYSDACFLEFHIFPLLHFLPSQSPILLSLQYSQHSIGGFPLTPIVSTPTHLLVNWFLPVLSKWSNHLRALCLTTSFLHFLKHLPNLSYILSLLSLSIPFWSLT